MPGRSFLGGPPSPFTGRSTWRRFREDSLPALRQGLATFWTGPLRTPVLAVVACALVAALGFSLRRLTPVEGSLAHPGGRGVEGAEVEARWYVRRSEAFENLGRPLARTFGNPMDVAVEEASVRVRTTHTAADGSFRMPGGFTLAWPGTKGPFVRVRFKVKDELSGRSYPVRVLRLADGSELAGGVDTGAGGGVRDLDGVLDKLELPVPGRIRDIAVNGERIATAEGAAGVRLYRSAPAPAPGLELVAHRLPAGSEETLSVGFMSGNLVVFRTRGFDLMELGPELTLRGSEQGAYERLLAADDGRLAVLGADGVELFRSGTLLQRTERVPLADAARAAAYLGPELVRMAGSRLFYLYSDGTVRFTDVDSAFRTPATLTETGGPAVGFSYVGESSTVLLASATGVSVYDVQDPSATRRTARIELEIRPVTVIDRVVVGLRGIAVIDLGLSGATRGISVALDLEEVEAASAFRVGDSLVVPRLEDVQARTRTVGIRWDPVLGKTVDRTLRLRDTARLVGAHVIDLETAASRDITLATRPQVLFREDGLNRSLVVAVGADGTAYFATAEGRLLPMRLP